METFVAWLTLAVMLAIYFLPAIVAIGRKHDNQSAIVVLNLLLGWTMIGWVVALIWSFTHQRKVA